jgi:hypothetical protein
VPISIYYRLTGLQAQYTLLVLHTLLCLYKGSPLYYSTHLIYYTELSCSLSVSFSFFFLSLSLFSTWYQSHFLVAFNRLSGNVSTAVRAAVDGSTVFRRHIVLPTPVHLSTVIFSSHHLHQTDWNREIYSTPPESSLSELSRSLTRLLKILPHCP